MTMEIQQPSGRVLRERVERYTRKFYFDDAVLQQNVGQDPEITRVIDGCNTLKVNQEESLISFLGPDCNSGPLLNPAKGRCAIFSPTASGKSIVIQACARALVEAREGQPLTKALILIPTTDIAKGFRPSYNEDGSLRRFLLPGGAVLAWNPPEEQLLFHNGTKASKQNVQRTVDFLLGEPSENPWERLLVCTQACFIAARKKIAEMGVTDFWEGVHLLIDECHHLKTGNLKNDAYLQSLSNKLGAITLEFLAARLKAKVPGSIVIGTATYLRGDTKTILPRAELDQFTIYEYPYDEFLRRAKYLRKINFTVDITSSFAQSVAQAVVENPRLTLVYQPTINPGEGSGKKIEHLGDFYAALGPSVDSGDGFSRTHTTPSGLKVKSVDLVTPKGRSERLHLFQANPKSVDVVFVQRTFIEGTDCAALERTILCGARGSLAMLIQMFGRILRDYLDKDLVEFRTLVPTSMECSVENVRTWLEVTFTVAALGWHFSADLSLPAIARSQAVIQRINDSLPEAFNDNQTPADLVGRIIQEEAAKVGERFDPKEHPQLSGFSKHVFRGAVRVVAQQLERNLTESQARKLHESIEENPFNGTRDLASFMLNPDKLYEFRQSLSLPPASLEEHRAFGKGKTTLQYDRGRIEHSKKVGKTFVQAPDFPKHFGMTYKEVMTGARSTARLKYPQASLEEHIAFGRGRTSRQYELDRIEHSNRVGKTFIQCGNFYREFGMTYSEVMTGARKTPLRYPPASIVEVRDFAKGKTRDQYGKGRVEHSKKIGKHLPKLAAFLEQFGMTYQDVRAWVEPVEGVSC